jgi:chemotaxis protein MotB
MKKKMKKSIFMMSLVSVLLFTSCASKKDLVACQGENKALQTNYKNIK